MYDHLNMLIYKYAVFYSCDDYGKRHALQKNPPFNMLIDYIKIKIMSLHYKSSIIIIILIGSSSTRLKKILEEIHLTMLGVSAACAKREM